MHLLKLQTKILQKEVYIPHFSIYSNKDKVIKLNTMHGSVFEYFLHISPLDAQRHPEHSPILPPSSYLPHLLSPCGQTIDSNLLTVSAFPFFQNTRAKYRLLY